MDQPPSQLTPYVVITCIMAGSGGLMYGYDLVVAGGISVMNDFLAKFYPEVLVHKLDAKEDNYCRYSNNVFQLYSSCLYLAALPATVLASVVTSRFGRRPTMVIAGLLFCLGTALGTAAQNLGMLLSGRALIGCGLGFSNQVVPLYISEIAPPRLRGGLNYLFVVYAGLGIFSGNLVNYFSGKIHPWGWRLSLGIAGIPALMLTLFSLILVESPSSLVQRGRYEEAQNVLIRIRGSKHQVHDEFEDLVGICQKELAMNNQISQACFNLFQRKHITPLVFGIAFPFFQQLSGNDAILFYGPFLFKLAGFGDQAALYSTVIIGGTGFLTTCAAAFLVDRFGRRKLLLMGGALMVSSMVVVGSIFATGLPRYAQMLPRAESRVEVAMVVVFVFAFSGTLGPLAWLVPSEVYPLEVRSLGLSVTVVVNMVFKFLIAQTFLSMLCAFKYGIFFFFAGWVLTLIVFVALLLPETKGRSIDDMQGLWQEHWLWRLIVRQPKSISM